MLIFLRFYLALAICGHSFDLLFCGCQTRRTQMNRNASDFPTRKVITLIFLFKTPVVMNCRQKHTTTLHPNAKMRMNGEEQMFKSVKFTRKATRKTGTLFERAIRKPIFRRSTHTISERCAIDAKLIGKIFPQSTPFTLSIFHFLVLTRPATVRMLPKYVVLSTLKQV